MRNMFAEALYREATENPDIFIVVADISPVGNMAKFRTEYPERFINVGVAEQSMIGICAGLALKGCQPFAYTIATFSLYRPFEIVRDDLCYQNLPVTVVGMGAGVIYSDHGGTHHTMEDIAIAGAIPNMQIVAPCDPAEVAEATRWCARQRNGPVYLHRQVRRTEPDPECRSLGVWQVALPAPWLGCLHPLLRRHKQNGGRAGRPLRGGGKIGLVLLLPHAKAARPRRHHRSPSTPQARHRHRGACPAGRACAADQADRVGYPSALPARHLHAPGSVYPQ